MGLQLNEIRQISKKGLNKGALSRAVRLQNRVKFHAETHVAANQVGGATADFLAFVKNLLPSDKYKMFTALMRYPLITNEVVSVCFDKLSRVFDGRNPVYSYNFESAELAADWDYYRRVAIGEPSVWSKKAWEWYKTEYNAVAVVDMPNGVTDEPRPYFYFTPILNVIDIATTPDGVIKWIMTRQPHELVSVIDDEYFRLFKSDKSGEPAELVEEIPHGLGYCPATFISGSPIALTDPIVRQSPLTKVLDTLDWYLFYSISNRHLDLYGSYPIYSGYAPNCNYINDATGDYCDGGFLRDSGGHWHYDSAGQLVPCPKCGQKRIMGAGTFVDIPQPNEKGDEADYVPDMRNPVQMLSVDRNSLDFSQTEVNRLRESIITAVCGANEDVQGKEALNERQVTANFESQTTVLGRVKRDFERLQLFVDSTICRLRYGDDFISASIDYGTEFYLDNVEQLHANYATAKQAGASTAELDALADRITETQYRNNPAQLQRAKVLSDLEPFRHMTVAEVVELFVKGAISELEMKIKTHFGEYIRRFERENLNVVDFENTLPYYKKIEIINNKLTEYANN